MYMERGFGEQFGCNNFREWLKQNKVAFGKF